MWGQARLPLCVCVREREGGGRSSWIKTLNSSISYNYVPELSVICVGFVYRSVNSDGVFSCSHCR